MLSFMPCVFRALLRFRSGTGQGAVLRVVSWLPLLLACPVCHLRRGRVVPPSSSHLCLALAVLFASGTGSAVENAESAGGNDGATRRHTQSDGLAMHTTVHSVTSDFQRLCAH